jgi:hypothetical protein
MLPIRNDFAEGINFHSGSLVTGKETSLAQYLKGSLDQINYMSCCCWRRTASVRRCQTTRGHNQMRGRVDSVGNCTLVLLVKLLIHEHVQLLLLLLPSNELVQVSVSNTFCFSSADKSLQTIIVGACSRCGLV